MSLTSARGEEVITSFDAEITIEENGDLLVTETIKVISEGIEIRRGIYRDFPRLINIEGRNKTVGFEILSIKRDGKNEPYHTENADNFTRIYIGDADVYLPSSNYTYELTYRTDRQLRFFSNHDELLWNVTGTEWIFPIEKASATIILPDDVIATDAIFFTGGFGSRQKNAKAKIFPDTHQIRFETTAPLTARQGLTVGIKMPKGSFKSIPEEKRWVWFWRDFSGEILAILAFLISGYYFVTRWIKYGRDPEPGIIAPRWDMPDNVSPALVNYIEETGNSSSHTGMIAAFLNLAVKGYVTIEGLEDKPTITRTEKPSDSELGIGERALIEKLNDRENRSIKFSKSNGSSVKSMAGAFERKMNKEHDSVYYRHNWMQVFVGITITVVCLLAVFFIGNVHEETFGMLVTTVLSASILMAVISIAGYFLEIEPDGFSIAAIIIFGLILLLGMAPQYVPFLSYFENWIVQPILLALLFAIIMMGFKFIFILGAPTVLGREKMDAIAGLKTYLVLAEKDRMNLAGAPKMSPQHFEKLLPYAAAMGVEKPWSNSFQTWLAAAAVAGVAAHHYSPGWYRGRFQTDRLNEELGGISNSMSSSLTASLPVPKSSSSGSSSSSGGGGGGGGGGGW